MPIPPPTGFRQGKEGIMSETPRRPIPLAQSFHIGRMVPSHRDVVDQSYQVGLHLLFADKAAEEAYQVHPLHLEFVEKAFKPNCARATIFDFAP